MLDDRGQNLVSCPPEEGHVAEEPITIVMVDDHASVRCSLRALLDMERDLRVVDDVGSRAEAIAVVVERRPAVLLLDIELSDGNCFPVVDELALRCPETRVILHSGRWLDAYLWLARSKSNCKGMLDKIADPNVVIAAIRAVASGSKYYDPGIKSRLDRPFELDLLTPREIKTLILVVRDNSAKMAAPKLGIKPRGVEAHIENIKKKLGLHTNVALANFAHRVGLLKIA